MMITDEQIEFLAEAARQKRLQNAKNESEVEWINRDVEYWKDCMKVFKRYCEDVDCYMRRQRQIFVKIGCCKDGTELNCLASHD